MSVWVAEAYYGALVPGFCIISVTMVVLYTKIALTARKQHRAISAATDISLNQETLEINARQKRTSRGYEEGSNTTKPEVGSSKHNKTATLKKHRKQYKITKMMGRILGLYFLFYLPSPIMATLDPDEKSFAMTVLKHVAYLLWYTNSWINFIVYAYSLTEFKEAFIKILNLQKSLQ